MPMSANRAILLATAMALTASACGGNGAVPSNAGVAGAASRAAVPATDTTSILKLLTKNVTIGSTVDPKNGDKGPRAISVVQSNFGELKAGHVLVCNFEDSSGKAGNGTTIEQFEPVASSKPTASFKTPRLRDATATLSRQATKSTAPE